MRKIAEICLLVGCALFLFACQGTQKPRSDAVIEPAPIAVVSVADPSFRLRTPTGFSWLLPTVNSASLSDRLLYEAEGAIREAITRELDKRGVGQVSSDQAELMVAYVLITDSGMSDQAIIAKYGMHTGLTLEDQGRKEIGSLVIVIKQIGKAQPVWRGVAQGVVRPELTAEQRRVRLNTAVTRLIESFPAAR